MGIEAISHEAISISTYILYLYLYQAMYKMEKSGLQNTSPTSHRSNHWLQRTSVSSEVRVSRKHLNFAWGWSNIKNVFLVFKKFQPIILKSTTFLLFSQMHQNALLANADLRPFLFHTSSYHQHKHCTIEGNQSGNPSFLPYNLHQVWSPQNGWHLIWAPAEPSRPGPGPVSDHLGVEFSSLCHMTINKNWIKQNVGWYYHIIYK